MTVASLEVVFIMPISANSGASKLKELLGVFEYACVVIEDATRVNNKQRCISSVRCC